MNMFHDTDYLQISLDLGAHLLTEEDDVVLDVCRVARFVEDVDALLAEDPETLEVLSGDMTL